MYVYIYICVYTFMLEGEAIEKDPVPEAFWSTQRKK